MSLLADVNNNADPVEGFEDLYQVFAPLVYARARRLLGGDQAEDVVQEVFLRIFQKRPESSGLKTWIYTTTTNLCLDIIRHGKRRDPNWGEQLRQHMRELQRQHSLSEDDIADWMFDRQVFEMLLSGCNQTTQRIVILLVKDEMSISDVARILGVSRKKVNTHWKRFLKRARKVLEKWLK
jgi:RNA polymerase sigma-70 factor (ECF subfamily)